MKFEQLKSAVESYRQYLSEKSGQICLRSQDGPVNMNLIDDIIKFLESQELRLQKIEKQLQ